MEKDHGPHQTEIGPPIASPGCPVAQHLYSVTRPSRPIASHSDNVIPRPRSTRCGSSASYRRHVHHPTSEWTFLSQSATETHTQNHSIAFRQQRPATARGNLETNNGHNMKLFVNLPKRPATCRTRTRQPSTIDASKSFTPRSSSLGGRVLKEAARQELDQVEYTSPLLAKSVELKNKELLHRSSASVANAVSLPEFYRVKAFQSRAKGNYREAIEYYANLVKCSNTTSTRKVALFQLALAYEKIGDYKRAFTTYEKVLALDKEDPFTHYNMGNILMRTSRVKDAIDCYTRAILNSKTNSKEQLLFYRQRAAAYRINGDFERAARDFAYCHKHGHEPSFSLHDLEEMNTCSKTSTCDNQCGERQPVKEALALTSIGDMYTSEPVYRVVDGISDKLEIPFEAWTHKRSMKVASSPQDTRSIEDLEFLMDYLQKQFPFCAALQPQVCLQLCANVIGFVNIAKETPLLLENTEGSHVFLICKGRISASKTIVQGIADDQEAKIDDNASEEPLADNQDLDNDYSHFSLEQLVAATTKTKNESKSLDQFLIQSRPARWKDRQMHLCELGAGTIVGAQGRFNDAARTYSVITTQACDIIMLSWHDLVEIEEAQAKAQQASIVRFLCMAPVFEGIPANELKQLALKAKSSKIVGSKVICCEEQFVDGLIIVREGELFQISPSGIRLPPDPSIAFNLCGSLITEHHNREKAGLVFFTKLEQTGDPLGFLKMSGVIHGFLPNSYLEDRLKLFQKNKAMHVTPDKTICNSATTAIPMTAVTIPRGAFFCASSSWIPPRTSREYLMLDHGVACAKSALITSVSAEILFFTSTDLVQSLSAPSRDLLHQNILQCETSPATATRWDSTHCPTAGTQKRNSSWLLYKQHNHSNDLLEKRANEAEWKQYKHRLVQTILEDKKSRQLRFKRNIITIR